MEELMQALADHLLQSGFEDQFTRYQQVGERDQTMQALREAIRKALLSSDLMDEEMRQQMEQMQAEGKFDKAKGAVHHAVGDAKDSLRDASKDK